MRGWFFDTQTVAALHQTIAALERECEKHKNAVAVYNQDCIAAEKKIAELERGEFICNMALLSAAPVAWYDLDQMTVYTPVKPTIPGTWTPLYAAPQQSAGEPVAWCLQSNRDGSYGVPVIFTGYAMYKQNLTKARQEPWIVNGVAKLVPLYAAPQQKLAAAPTAKEGE
jgi:hypothetical protein